MKCQVCCAWLVMAGLMAGAPSTWRAAAAQEAEENVTAEEKQRRAELSEHVRRAAADYEMFVGQERLRLREEPLLNWSNAVNGDVRGSVFVWTANGRPEAIASIHKWFSRRPQVEEHELHSLSLSPLRATRSGSEVWRPEGPGVTLQALADATPPAKSPRARLSQMKELAGDFRVVYEEKKNRVELRLLIQPLYRYESTDPDVLDGALFAFVRTTDPDALVLIEARKTDDGMRWHYGLARQNAMALRFLHRDKVVAEMPNCWDRVRTHPEDPYIALKFVEGEPSK